MSETRIPQHVGLILDGNRRWAKAHSLPTLEGHRRGGDNITTIARHAFKRGVKYVSAYVFSTENWNRSQKEVNYLMSLVTKMMEKYLEDLHKEGIRIVILGRRDGLRAKVLAAVEKVEETTKHNTKGVLALCFNYGGREELVDAVKQVVASGADVNQLDAESLAQYLYQPTVPDIDLLIRTSGEQRLSGYMLYRAAYAELYFTDTQWPGFSPDEFDAAVDWYAQRDRRFGA